MYCFVYLFMLFRQRSVFTSLTQEDSPSRAADVHCLPAVVDIETVSLKVDGSANLLVVHCFDTKILDAKMEEVKRKKPKPNTKRLPGDAADDGVGDAGAAAGDGHDGDGDGEPAADDGHDDDAGDDDMLEDDLGRVMSEFWAEEEKRATAALDTIERTAKILTILRRLILLKTALILKPKTFLQKTRLMFWPPNS